MTGITITNQKRMLLLSGRAHPELTDEIAQCLVFRDALKIRHDLFRDRHRVVSQHLGDLADVHQLLDTRNDEEK